MTGLAFDTLKYTKRLKDAGVAAPQAETQAEFLAEVMTENLASKEDLARLETRIDTRFKEQDTKMETRFKELETRMETRFKEQDTKMETRFKELEAKMETRFKEQGIEFKRDNRELELRMVIKLGAMTLAGFGLMVTANRLWPVSVQYVQVPHVAQEMHTPSQPVQRMPDVPPPRLPSSPPVQHTPPDIFPPLQKP
ncbi:MAG: hypothetical protein HQL65_11285 [Magnetococcales bacterium]|nr:hypothetical protein [Magnetococcales bacterium]